MLYVINLNNSGGSLPETDEVEEVGVNTRAYLTIDPDDDYDRNATYAVTKQEADLFVVFYAWLLREGHVEVMIPYRFSEKPIGDIRPFEDLMKELSKKIGGNNA